MNINLGKTDKYIRVVAGMLAILGGIVFQSWWGILGAVLLITALINWCPVYALFNINTRSK
jgi:hypothetical protein